MSEGELEHLKRKVGELEKKTESIVMVINMTNQIFMSLFDKTMRNTERMLSLLEKLPENIAKVAVEQLKKDLRESEEMLQKARKNSYVA
jgi:hypothetical protein